MSGTTNGASGAGGSGNIPCLDALTKALKEIPSQTYALVFVDDSDVTMDSIYSTVKKAFLSRGNPNIFKGSDYDSLLDPVLRSVGIWLLIRDLYVSHITSLHLLAYII